MKGTSKDSDGKLIVRFVASVIILFALVSLWNFFSVYQFDLNHVAIGSACLAALLLANIFLSQALFPQESVSKTRKIFLILSGAGVKISLLAALLRYAPTISVNQGLSLCVGVSGILIFGALQIFLDTKKKT